MNLDDFSYEENGRRYIKPEVSLGEQNAFIDNLRGLQQDKTAEISRDTYNLGTAIPSNLGGLTGGSGYFKARYQTPQTNSMVSDLRAAAQSQALTTLLNNEISKAKKRYNDAYRAAKKRENASSSSTSGGNGAYLSSLTAEANNDKSGDLQDTQESSDETLKTTPSKQALLDAARSNLGIWERQLKTFGNKNIFELLWTLDEQRNATSNIKKYRDEIARLEALED